MTQIPLRKLVHWMLQEEWRLHKRVVGNRAFVGFPLVLALLSTGVLYAANQFGGNPETAAKLAHVFVFGFGLHMGNIALTGRDAIEDLLGGITFLVYSSRTMPVSTARLVGVFLLKDVLYYAWLVTAPIALGFAVVFPLATVVRLAVALTLMFMFGIVVALLGVDVMAHSRRATLIGLAAIGVVGGAAVGGVPVYNYTPYAVYALPGLVSVAASLVMLGGGALVGVRYFSPNIDERLRVVNDRFTAWRDFLPTQHSSMAAKTLLDVNRSNGGVIKLLVSASLVWAVSVYLFVLLQERLLADPHVGIALGGLLALEGFLVYTWMVRFDSLDEYAFLPVTAPTLVRGKTVAFTLVALPLAVCHYVLSLAFVKLSTTDMVLGGALLVSLLVYLFGVTLTLARLEPHEHLFHPLRFLVFAVAVFTPLAVVFWVAFTIPAFTQSVVMGLASLALCCLLVGWLSLRRAATQWEVTAP